MKALRFSRTGSLSHLELVECPAPKPADGGVLVRVKAARLNKSDTSNVLGKHAHTTLPRTPGRDYSGVVVEGPAEHLGREVWGTSGALGFTRDGTHAEYLALAADEIADKPKSLSFSQAACCGVPFTTAWSALERSEVTRGSRVLVVGAAGAVGSAALALARLRGAQIVGAVRRAEQAASLAARGIAAIVLPADGSLAAALKPHFADGADVILDATGFWLPASVSALARFGRVAVIVAPGDGHVNVPVRDLYRRSAGIVGINSMLFSAAECARVLARLAGAFDRGELQASIETRECALEDYARAYEEASRAAGANFVFVMP